ncbi:MAG: polyhydroxyalkanoic acid system family protein [Candidatus Pacebacteria bacterium]|nr:polyhydroxyalkanoic acid system family protein [Candidatus Paceibacterota bacterium]
MHLEIPHKTNKQEALVRVKHGLDEMRAKMGDQATIHEERWDVDTLHFDVTAQSQRISGTLKVEDKNFVIDAKLPLMLRLFEGRIEREIMQQVQQLQ